MQREHLYRIQLERFYIYIIFILNDLLLILIVDYILIISFHKMLIERRKFYVYNFIMYWLTNISCGIQCAVLMTNFR